MNNNLAAVFGISCVTVVIISLFYSAFARAHVYVFPFIYSLSQAAVLFFFLLFSVHVAGQTFVYSQLSRKRQPLVHEKVVAYERWTLMRKINEIKSKLHRSTNNNCYGKVIIS